MNLPRDGHINDGYFEFAENIIQNEDNATVRMHIEIKQPQVFILIQSYLASVVSPKHGSQWLLQMEFLWLKILYKKNHKTFELNISMGLVLLIIAVKCVFGIF